MKIRERFKLRNIPSTAQGDTKSKRKSARGLLLLAKVFNEVLNNDSITLTEESIKSYLQDKTKLDHLIWMEAVGEGDNQTFELKANGELVKSLGFQVSGLGEQFAAKRHASNTKELLDNMLTQLNSIIQDGKGKKKKRARRAEARAKDNTKSELDITNKDTFYNSLYGDPPWDLDATDDANDFKLFVEQVLYPLYGIFRATKFSRLDTAYVESDTPLTLADLEDESGVKDIPANTKATISFGEFQKLAGASQEIKDNAIIRIEFPKGLGEE